MQPLISANGLQFILKAAETVVSALVLSGVCVLLILWILRLIQVKNLREHTLHLTNQGNVPSTYQLAVFSRPWAAGDSRQPLLGFKMLFNGTPLAELPVELPPAPARPPQPPKAQKAPRGKSKAAPKNGAGQKLEQTGNAAATTAGNAAGLLGTLGSVIPGGAGQALKDQGANLRDVQTKTKDAVEAPEEAKRKAEALQKSGQRLGVKVPDGGKPQTAAEREIRDEVPAGPAAGNGPAQIPSSAPEASGRSLRAAGIPGTAYCVQTPELAPGDSFDLTLQITPKKRRFPEGSYPYTLISKQIPVEALNREAPLVSKQGLAHLKPVAGWRYGVRFLAGAAVILAGVSGFVFIFTLIWK